MALVFHQRHPREKHEDGKYKNTVDLPKTIFGMRVNFAINEPELTGKKIRCLRDFDRNIGLLEIAQVPDSHEARKALTLLKLRAKAAKLSKTTVKTHRASSKIEVFGEMSFPGHIFRGRKLVHRSPSSRTALAEAESERNFFSHFVLVDLDHNFLDYPIQCCFAVNAKL